MLVSIFRGSEQVPSQAEVTKMPRLPGFSDLKLGQSLVYASLSLMTPGPLLGTPRASFVLQCPCSIYLKYLLLFYVCRRFANMYVCVPGVHSIYGGQKKVSNFPGLDL